MEYPNKDLRKFMLGETHRADLDATLFGDTQDLMAPPRNIIPRFSFKQYGTSVSSLFNRHQ